MAGRIVRDEQHRAAGEVCAAGCICPAVPPQRLVPSVPGLLGVSREE